MNSSTAKRAVSELRAEVSRLRGQVAAYREALEPFARLLPLGGYDLPPEDVTLPAKFADVQHAQRTLRSPDFTEEVS